MIFYHPLVWILLVTLVSIPCLLAPWPLLGFVGGIIRFIGYKFSGPIFVFHCFLLIGYASFVKIHVEPVSNNININDDDKQRKRRLDLISLFEAPVAISILTILSIAIPAISCLLTCSPQWIVDNNNSNNNIINHFLYNYNNHEVVSFSKWIRYAGPCPKLEDFKVITSVYNESIPPFGPYSREPYFFSWGVQKHIQRQQQQPPKTNLSTYYFPLPPLKKQRSKGILIWIHGGGWWMGSPLDDVTNNSNPMIITTCKAQFAHDNGWDFAAIEYRLGQHGWSGYEQNIDVQDAIRHIIIATTTTKEHTTKKVIVQGSSAGAHLALLASYQLNHQSYYYQQQQQQQENQKEVGQVPPQPTPPHIVVSAVVANNPSTSIKIGMNKEYSIPQWSGAWNEAQAHQRLCGGGGPAASEKENERNGDDDDDYYNHCHQRLSPIEWVSSSNTTTTTTTKTTTITTPQTILIHSGSDEFFTPEHSRSLAQKLKEKGIPYMYMEPPFQPHMMGLIENSIVNQMVRYAMKELMMEEEDGRLN